MDNFLLYALISAITVASPGPGVILTLSNIIRYNFITAFSGILGIATGIFIVSVVSVTSIGILLATSATAFMLMKLIGAAYLIYLGIKLWRAPTPAFTFKKQVSERSLLKHFIEGLSITLLNPKAIFFFMSLFPQFIDLSKNYTLQFTYLTLTFCGLIIVIHTLYALFAHAARRWLSSTRGRKNMNRASGSAFILFGLGLGYTHR